MNKHFKYLGFNDMGKTTLSTKEQCNIDLVSNSTKPTMEKYGYQNSTSFDEETGWMYEGGEDAYYEALKAWEKENGY